MLLVSASILSRENSWTLFCAPEPSCLAKSGFAISFFMAAARARGFLDLARTKGQVGNDDVEQALQISNATAERYLDELESIGKLIQIGKTGRNVTYKLKQ